VARFGQYAIDLHGVGWGGAISLGGGIDAAQSEHLALTIGLDAAALLATPPNITGGTLGPTAAIDIEATLGLRWDRKRQTVEYVVEPAEPGVSPTSQPWSRAAISSSVTAGIFLTLAALNTAAIPVAAYYGLGEPFGLIGPLVIPFAAAGAIAFTVAGALFIREANRVRRSQLVSTKLRR
jgi:hypothetical protein